MANPVSGAAPLMNGFSSKASSQVRSVLGKTTTTFAGTLMATSPTSSHPPVVLHWAGKGGFAGDGLGLNTQRPGLASSDAYCSIPVTSNATGTVCDAGTMADGGGTAAGVGHGRGVAISWADKLEPIADTSSRSIIPATFIFLRTCSNPLILKLLPSYCGLLVQLCPAGAAVFVSCWCPLELHRHVRSVAGNLVGSGIFPPHQVVEEGGKRLTAIRTDRRNFHELIGRLSGVLRISLDRIGVARGMPVGNNQLWVIKRSGLLHRAWISQPVAKEVHQVLPVLEGETKDLDIGIHVLHFSHGVEVTAAVVILHHLLQGELAAVVEVRSRQSNVPQLRSLEEAAARHFVRAIQWGRCDTVSTPSRDDDGFKATVADVLPEVFRVGKRQTSNTVITGKTSIFSRRPDADVIVARVIHASAIVFHDHALDRSVGYRAH